jgi:hypothetical protein
MENANVFLESGPENSKRIVVTFRGVGFVAGRISRLSPKSQIFTYYTKERARHSAATQGAQFPAMANPETS